MAQGVASAPALQQGYREQGRPADQGSSPRREPHRHTYGAIDLGTNNCRLLIARPNEGGFTVIDAFSRIVRLGEGLSRTGELSKEAMDRAVAALSVCADKLRRRNVSLTRSVATEACRRARNGREFTERVRTETGILGRPAMDRAIEALKICAGKLADRKVERARLIATEACRVAANGPEFVARVGEETGLSIEIVSQETEARLAVAGCASLVDSHAHGVILFDIGGGSTELVLIDQDQGTPRIRAW